MNNARRERLQQMLSVIALVQLDLELIRDEEQEYFDNMPPSLQDGEKGDKASNCIENLDNAIELFSDIENYINDSKE